MLSREANVISVIHLLLVGNSVGLEEDCGEE